MSIEEDIKDLQNEIKNLKEFVDSLAPTCQECHRKMEMSLVRVSGRNENAWICPNYKCNNFIELNDPIL